MAGGTDTERPHDEEESEGDKEEGASSTSMTAFLREVAFAPRQDPPRAENIRIGSLVDRFQITGMLGRGGMGVVYSALDLSLKRKVALKLLSGAGVENEERRRRFQREARMASAVSHPNVAAVFDVGEADGVVFIAMECVEGRSLRAVMKAARNALPERESAQIARAIARGLAAAHEVGVTHRDIKPENVMVSNKGVVKLVDFGLAKGRDVNDATDTRESKSIFTQKGRIIGTPSYMSPEQVRGLPADARSDVFSFGVVLFEMLARERPFRGATVADLHTAILRDEPPPLLISRDGAGGLLARVVSRCLEKEPSQRYAHAGELLAALEGASLTVASALPPPSRRRWWFLLAGPVTAVIAVGVVQTLRAPSDAPPPQPQEPRRPPAPTAIVETPTTRAVPLPVLQPSYEPGVPFAPFRFPLEDRVTALSLSYNAVALTSSGDILMWGPAPALHPTWLKPGGIPQVKAIATSVSGMMTIMMAVDRAGNVWGWTDRQFHRPVRLDNTSSVRSVALSLDGALLLQEDSSLSFMGFAQLPSRKNKGTEAGGDTYWMARARTQVVPGIDRVKAISVQHDLWLALREDGTVWSWENLPWRPGSGPLVAHPRQVQGMAGMMVAIASGYKHSLALGQDGAVWAWGDDTYHQVGREDRSGDAARVPGLPMIMAIAAGTNGSLALDESGRVWQWGMPFGGNTKMIALASQDASLPHVVEGLPRARLIGSAGSFAFVVAVDDGGLWAWGLAHDEELWYRNHPDW